ncbi:MarR family transcriptional regulator [Deinococcus yavapaiensis]|uniref:MarR family transcriptional regulator n=1 Tax=Deinococcus yavapaiensis TaxID=309889 RepID=UPI000DA15F72|nr:helix-turn-helix domain-containing protein [Deinococcus yavapaiensis]
MNDTLIYEQDQEVLHAIQLQGNATVAALAAHLGLPVLSVRASVNRLLVRGHIRGHKISDVRVEYHSA